MDPQFPRRLWISCFPDLFWFFLAAGSIPDQDTTPAHCSEAEESSGHWSTVSPQSLLFFVPMR